MFAIKKMREAAGMTQQEVADVLGIRKGRYGDWERETREINFREAIALADLFGCSLDELAGRPFPKESVNLTAKENIVIDAMRSVSHEGEERIVESAMLVAESPRFAKSAVANDHLHDEVI